MYKDEDGFMPTGAKDLWGNPYGYRNGKPCKRVGYKQYVDVKTDKEKFEEFWGLNEEKPQDTGPSYSDVVYDAFDNGMQECKRVFNEGNEKMAKDIAKAMGLGIGAVAAGTFAAEYAKDPGNMENAVKKAGRNAACVAGIIGVIILMCVLTLVFVLFGSGLGNIGSGIIIVLTLMGYYTIFGLIRVMRNRTFLIHIKKPKDIKVPGVVYVVIVLASIFSLFNPLVNWLDGTIGEWVYANKDMFTDLQMLLMAIGMMLLAVIISGLAGLLVCGIIKVFTGSSK